MARKTKQEAQETRQHILDVALRLFSQQGVSSTSLGEIAKAAGVTRGAIYWHFKDKSDLFSEIWELSESNIGELELEYQAKFPGDPLSVLREILIHVLESTVTEERRRLLMEIIFHKCEFVGEMAVVQQAQRNGFAPIFPDTCYHLTHYWPAAADIPVASDNPVHYADAIRYNARTPLQGSLLPLTRLV